jgi:hypothetical protein
VTFYIDENGDTVDLSEPSELDPEPERHTPVVDHRGDVWQDRAGWFVASCDCGWSRVTWTSKRAAEDMLRRHSEKSDQ